MGIVLGAESVLSLPEHERLTNVTKMGSINKDLCENIKKKLSGDSESSFRSMEQMPASKRARVEEEVDDDVRVHKSEDLGRDTSGFMLGQWEQLLRAGFNEDLEECQEKLENLSQVEKKAYNEQKKSIVVIVQLSVDKVLRGRSYTAQYRTLPLGEFLEKMK